MNKDFHYYGTYFAATIAGFDEEAARKIAFYAQFVDECTKRTMDKLVPNGQIGNVNMAPVYTAQSVKGQKHKYGYHFNAFTNEELAQVEPIWTAFHFLPGDNKENGQRRELICQKNSKMVLAMVTKLINECRQKPKYAYIGMVMHILADTWAHYGFAGVPSWELNEVEGAVTNLRDNTYYTYNYLFDNIDKNILQCTLRAPRENSICYLGHGRIGHLPDLGHEKYSYKQKCEEGKKIEVVKDNPEDFENALYQMLYVMRCIKWKEVFDENKFKNINRVKTDQEMDPKIKKSIVLVMQFLTERKSDNDICAKFGSVFTDEEKNAFPDRYILSGKDSLLEYMDENTGVVEAYFAEEHNRELLAQFFDAAREHRAWVLDQYHSINR